MIKPNQLSNEPSSTRFPSILLYYYICLFLRETKQRAWTQDLRRDRKRGRKGVRKGTQRGQLAKGDAEGQSTTDSWRDQSAWDRVQAQWGRQTRRVRSPESTTVSSEEACGVLSKQTTTYWRPVPLSLPALLYRSAGLLNRESWGPIVPCWVLVLTTASYLQLTDSN